MMMMTMMTMMMLLLLMMMMDGVVSDPQLRTLWRSHIQTLREAPRPGEMGPGTRILQPREPEKEAPLRLVSPR